MQTKRIELGASAFTLTPIPPFVALAMFGDLQKLLVPVLADLADSKGDEDQMDVGALMRRASEQFDGKMLTTWADRLLHRDWVSVSVNGSQLLPLDDAGRAMAFSDPGQILELMIEVLTFNFEGPIKSFANRFGSRIGRLSKAGNPSGASALTSSQN